MNRTVAYAGLVLVIAALLAVAIPFLMSGSFQVTVWIYLAGLVFLIGLVALLRGATSPDPGVTTVSGFLGNPIATETRRMSQTGVGAFAGGRVGLDPREPIHCRFCYTLIALDVLDCPRCGRRRICRICQRPLAFAGAQIRCASCGRDEVYCNCARARPVAVASVAVRRGR
jgi:hypothetical protein